MKVDFIHDYKQILDIILLAKWYSFKIQAVVFMKWKRLEVGPMRSHNQYAQNRDC